MRPVLIALLLAGCAAEGDLGDTGPDFDVPCPAADPALDLAHGDDPWGVEGLELGCGIPPQGGAPYSRFRVRVQGLGDLATGAAVEVLAFDADTGEQLGQAARMAGFVCANVGDNADHWVTSELHVRYDGFSVADLVGREVELSASVSTDDSTVTAQGWGVLTPM